MRMLLLFVVWALGCSQAEGRNVTKCDLLKAFEEKNLSKNIAAKVVCHAEKESGFNSSAVKRLTPTDGGVPATLYGLFQLSSRVACRDGSASSMDICGTKCSDFVDDDIDDDIDCVLKILKTIIDSKDIWGTPKELQDMVRDVFRMKCRGTEASYFSECDKMTKASQEGLSVSQMSGDL